MQKLYIVLFLVFVSCASSNETSLNNETKPDVNLLPDGAYKQMVVYGEALMKQTAYYIGPEGVNGKYLGNKMNCTNCHQEAGTKNYSFSLIHSHQEYPQYRSREDKVLSLAERVNNCVTRPHNGKPLPLDSKEMIAFLSYLKFINDWAADNKVVHSKTKKFELTNHRADTSNGLVLYTKHCARCHGSNGEGLLPKDSPSYQYPPLWGSMAYQPGSSMHRVIKQAQWLVTNMPYDLATANKPVLTPNEALDIAAFVNNDFTHSRPSPKTNDYANIYTKPLDYGIGPYADTFSAFQHKFGPYKVIEEYWKQKGWKPVY